MPKIPQVIAQQASFGRPANRLDFGAGQAEATRELAGSVAGVGDVAASLFEAEMVSNVDGALAQATKRLNDLELEVQANPDHNGRTDQYAAGARKIADEFREGMTFPAYQEQFDFRFEPSLERGRVQVKQGVQQAQIDSATANTTMFIEGKLDEAAKAADPQTRQGLAEEAVAAVNKAVENGIWSASQGAQRKIQIADRMEGEDLILRAQVIADELREEPDLEKRVAKANKLSGPLRDLVVARVLSQIDVDEGLRNKVRKAKLDERYQRAHAGDMTHEDLVVEAYWARKTGDPMSAQELSTLESAVVDATNRRNGVVAEPPGSYDLRRQLLDMAENAGTREAFLNLDLKVEFGGRLSQAHMDEVAAEQRKGPDEGFTKWHTLVQEAADRIYGDDAKRNRHWMEVVNFAKKRKEAQDGPMDHFEMMRLIEQHEDEIVVAEKSFWPDKTARLHQLRVGPEDLLPLEEWEVAAGFPPEEAETKIRQDLVSQGKIENEFDDSPEVIRLIQVTWLAMLAQRRSGAAASSPTIRLQQPPAGVAYDPSMVSEE